MRHQDTGSCDQGLPETVIRCWLYAESELTLDACDDDGCALTLDSGAYGMAHVPSALHVVTYARLPGSGGTVCEGVDVGRTVWCVGRVETTLPLAVGTCAEISLLSFFGWSVGAQSAYVDLVYEACRPSLDELEVAPRPAK